MTNAGKEFFVDAVGFSAGVPVRNLWLLMMYASDFKYQTFGYSGSENVDDNVANLVADVLCSQVEERLKRNLTFGYRYSARDLNRVRGKINMLETYSKQLLLKGKINCTFEELSVDTPRNQYISAALDKISGLVSKVNLKTRCQKLRKTMIELGVSPFNSSNYHPTNDRFGKHELADRRVLSSAELAFNLSLINESAGSGFYPLPEKQEYWVRKLFERAIAGFYKMKLDKTWQVKPSKKILWKAEEATSLIVQLLPTMEIDIQLNNTFLGKRIVIDTKFAAITKTNQYGQERFKRDYIFQLYAYLRSQEQMDDPLSTSSEGILLHPSVGGSVNERVKIQGHNMRFCTVDLTVSAPEVESQLLGLIET